MIDAVNSVIGNNKTDEKPTVAEKNAFSTTVSKVLTEAEYAKKSPMIDEKSDTDEPPFTPDTKSNFKKKNPNRSGMDSARALAQKALSGKKPVKEEDELQEAIDQISEALGKSATAADWIHDFVHSKNPKFEGKSKEKRKEMALAAYYGKQRNEEVEDLDEGLKGNQTKLDKNHNGKLDKQDFTLLRGKKINEKTYEGSPEDIKKDKEGMKRTGMTAKEWENSAEDKKKDAEGQKKLDKMEKMMEKMKEGVEQLEETPMDSFMHPKHGKVEWNNEGGSHVIVTKKPTGGKTIHAMGTHKEISQKFRDLKAKFAKEDVDLSIEDALSMLEEDAKKKSLVPDYTDSEWDDKIKSLKQKAQAGEGRVAYDPKTGKYRVAFDSKKLKETMMGKLAN
jgi:hypothetical protein